ncbi:hypothetical protein [Mucilaginibacter gynuensis]
MKPLIVLLVAFIISMVVLWLCGQPGAYALAGRIAMAVMLLFTASGHFAFTKGMVMMIPRFIPFKKATVYFTGIAEIILAVGLLFSRIYLVAGWAIIVLLVMMLPANIYAAINKVDYQKGTYTGSGINYLWFRVPLQVFFVVWIYFTAIR